MCISKKFPHNAGTSESGTTFENYNSQNKELAILCGSDPHILFSLGNKIQKHFEIQGNPTLQSSSEKTQTFKVVSLHYYRDQ